MIIGIILAVLVLIVVGVVFYFYNYYVFEEVRVCIGEGVDSEVPCDSRGYCLEVFNISLYKIEGAPGFVMETAEGVLEKAVYCNGTCFVRNIGGIDFESGEFEMGINCGSNEEEIVIEIRGSEGIEIIKWMKSKE